MAKKHFDEKGFPKLDLIVSEIKHYVENLEIEEISKNHARLKGLNLLTSDLEVIPHSGFEPRFGYKYASFKLEYVDVVSAQAKLLPEKYDLTQDLNLEFRINAGSFVYSDSITSFTASVLGGLHSYLNDGRKKWFVDETIGNFIDFAIEDIYSFLAPRLQIYPEMKFLNGSEDYLKERFNYTPSKNDGKCNLIINENPPKHITKEFYDEKGGFSLVATKNHYVSHKDEYELDVFFYDNHKWFFGKENLPYAINMYDSCDLSIYEEHVENYKKAKRKYNEEEFYEFMRDNYYNPILECEVRDTAVDDR